MDTAGGVAETSGAAFPVFGSDGSAAATVPDVAPEVSAKAVEALLWSPVEGAVVPALSAVGATLAEDESPDAEAYSRAAAAPRHRSYIYG